MSSTQTTPEGRWEAQARISSVFPVLWEEIRSINITFAVLWAQRSSSSNPERNYIHLTISAPDVPKIDVDLKATSINFTGHSDTKKTTYHVELDLFGEIDVENSKTIHTSRDVEFVLRKKELKEEYWPRLLKDKQKVHFLKTNFDKVGHPSNTHPFGCRDGCWRWNYADMR